MTEIARSSGDILPTPSMLQWRIVVRIHIGALWSWWLDEFRRLWPEVVVDWLTGRSRPRLWLTPEKDGVLVQAVTTAGKMLERQKLSWDSYAETGLRTCPFAARNPEQVLALPPDCFFRRSFAIPSLASSRLTQLARQEIERRTPFCLEDVFTHSWLSADPSNSQRHQVRQLIIRKDIIEANLARLGLPSHAFSEIAIEDGDRTLDHAIPLAAAESSRRSFLPSLLAALALIGAALTILFVAVTWCRQQTMIDDMTSRLATLQTKAQAVRHMIDVAGQTTKSIEVLLDRRRSTRALDLWEELSRLLPDDSWLTEFRLDERLSISGLSANAAGLVDILSRSKLLHDVGLSAPITTDPIAKKDRFSLTAKVVLRR